MRRFTFCAAIIIGILLAGCGSLVAQTSTENAAELFRYDNSVPLSVKETGVEKQGDITVSDITFQGASSPVKAYLVTPPGSGPFAGVLFVHWLGEPSTTNRTEFLKEAVALASKGTVSLLIDAMWAQPGWYEKLVPEEVYKNSIDQVIDLRRAMDLLLSRPHIDPARIAYVGHDFGAMYGAILGAVDPRAKTYVLMAGNSSLVDWYLYENQPRDLAAFKKQMSALNPPEYVGKINAPILFQFSSADQYIPADNALAFYKAAGPRKLMGTYKTDHSLKGADVDADRMDWLVRELGLQN